MGATSVRHGSTLVLISESRLPAGLTQTRISRGRSRSSMSGAKGLRDRWRAVVHLRIMLVIRRHCPGNAKRTFTRAAAWRIGPVWQAFGSAVA